MEKCAFPGERSFKLCSFDRELAFFADRVCALRCASMQLQSQWCEFRGFECLSRQKIVETTTTTAVAVAAASTLTPDSPLYPQQAFRRWSFKWERARLHAISRSTQRPYRRRQYDSPPESSLIILLMLACFRSQKRMALCSLSLSLPFSLYHSLCFLVLTLEFRRLVLLVKCVRDEARLASDVFVINSAK